MIDRIKQFFSERIVGISIDDPAMRIAMTTAALLVEVMITDGLINDSEEAEIERLLQEQLAIDRSQAKELLTLARSQVKDATSLYPLTTLVNQQFAPEQKFELLHQLWQVAYCDGFLNKHEEAVIRHIAELLYLPHSQFLRARNLARDGRS